MVVFTCFHCGDAVHKPGVQKHYQFKCRRPIALTCMDCLKDFDKDSFQVHTKCITEMERYSGKDYVPKESSNSGAKKQEDWLEIVKSVLDNPKEYQIGADLRHILQKLQSYENIPRKKAKFENFVRNSFKIHRDKAEVVWKLIEKALEKFKQKSQVQNKNDSQNSDGNKIENNEVTTYPNREASVSENKNLAKQEPSKKRKKLKEDNTNETNKQSGNGIIVSCDEIKGGDEPLNKKKKKDKSKNKQGIENNTAIVESINGKQEDAITTIEENIYNKSNAADEFDWNATIFKIVKKKPNGIHIDKLQEKVLKKYKTFYNIDEISHKVQKMFNKKLKKSSLLTTEDHIVKVMTPQ